MFFKSSVLLAVKILSIFTIGECWTMHAIELRKLITVGGFSKKINLQTNEIISRGIFEF